MLLPPKDFLEKKIELKDIFLDPNNPRFSTESEGQTPDSKVQEDSVQQKSLEKMMRYSLEDLKESIKKVGFVQIDKVVVRPLKTGGFVVVEGNRRIAALKSLEKEINEIQLDDDVRKTIFSFNVIVYTGNEKDIAWIIQGLRHISGIRNWPSYQQAEVLVKLAHEKKIRVREAANIVGIKPPNAARLVRAWHGYQEAKNDEDFGQYVRPDNFSYFDEVIFTKPVLQDWLKWDEKENRFCDPANLKKFLSWIFPGDDGKPPRLVSAMQLRDTLAPAMSRHQELFKRWENDESMTIERLIFELGKHSATEAKEWLEKIDDFNNDMRELPILKIEDKKADFKERLEVTLRIIQKHLAILEKL